jgi:hypothetical protein
MKRSMKILPVNECRITGVTMANRTKLLTAIRTRQPDWEEAARWADSSA